MKFTTGFIVLLLIVMSCKRQPSIEVDSQLDYLPLIVGSAIQYDVDSIVYNDFDGSNTTYSFVLKEEIVEKFEDAEGRSAFRVERSKRKPDSTYFEVMGSYSLTIDGSRAERLMNNEREVVLIFPPKNDLKWNGNTFNSEGRLMYEYSEVGFPYNLSSVSFPEALRVVQKNDTSNFVLKQYSEERYARGKGLIYKEYLYVQTNFEVDSGLHWVQKIRE